MWRKKIISNNFKEHFLCILFVVSTANLHADDLNLYYGLLHAHTHLSDGAGTPDEAYTAAKDAGIHFFALTEHNHDQAGGDDGVFLTPSGYEILKTAANTHTIDGEFVAIYGQEVSSISTGNHVNVFYSDTVVDIENGDFRDLYERYLVEHPEVPFIQLNHPNVTKDQSARTSQRERNNDYGIDDYNQSFRQLVAAAGNYVKLIELIVGPAFNPNSDLQHRDGRHQDDYTFYLNEGFRLAPSVGQDNHERNWGLSTEARMGVWAENLTKDSIIEALKSGRSYASEDRNLMVKLKLGESWMGDTVRISAGNEISMKLSFKDEDEPNANYKIALFYDDTIQGDSARIIDVVEVVGDTTNLDFTQTPNIGGYYFIRITQTSNEEFDPDDAWTAPIWIASTNDDAPGEEHLADGVIQWEDAHDYVGQEVIIEGEIVDSYQNDQAVFLNFNTNFRETLSLVIFSSHFDEFDGPDEIIQNIVGNKIQVSGEITTFRDRIQIIVSDSAQIEILP